MKLKNENSIIIQGWMINELGLKGNELLVYALIYGFSQDGESEFYGSRSYIAEWCSSSLPTIDKALNSLVEKEFIIKRTETINNVVFNRYRVNTDTLNEILGVVKKLYRGSKESLHNNINNNNKENILSKDNIQKKEKKIKNFIPPSFAEVQNYVDKNGYGIDVDYFYRYYSAGKWTDSEGKPVKNWKQRIVTWEKRRKEKQQNRGREEITYEKV